MIHQPQLLIVDDNKADVSLLSSVIHELGYDISVVAAFSGEEAVRAITRSRPDLVLLDINMPVMNGHQVLMRIKSDAYLQVIPVLMFSTSRDPGDVQMAYELGANAYIQKPSTLDGYMRTVSGLVRMWFSLAELPPV